MVPEMLHGDGTVRLGFMDDRGFVSDFANWDGRPYSFTFDDWKKSIEMRESKIERWMRRLTPALDDGLDNMVNVVMYVLMHYSAFIKGNILFGKASLSNHQI